VLPASYQPGDAVVKANREKRQAYFQGELSQTAANAASAFLKQGDYNQWLNKLEEDAGNIAKETSTLSRDDAIKRLQQVGGSDAQLSTLEALNFANVEEVTALVRSYVISRELGITGKLTQDRALLDAIFATKNAGKVFTLLDIVDPFSLVENKSIDGWVHSTGIWQKQGTIGQIVKGYANEEVNELFFDLRPVSSDTQTPLGQFAYSTDDDEIGENKKGIQYIPAMVMREYPFGTIPAIDGTVIKFTLKDKSGQVDNETLGSVTVGALFSDLPNVPGRHVLEQPAIDLATRYKEGAGIPTNRFLDVAVIHSSEIITHDLSRSDSDHFNLFEVHSGSFQMSDMKWQMADVLPISTPVHIMRHGLRTRTMNSQYAMFAPDIVRNKVKKIEQAAGVDPETVAPAGTTVDTVSRATVLAGASEKDDDLAVTTSIVVPVERTPTQGLVTSGLGYRARDLTGKVVTINSALITGGNWVYHYGVDINGQGTDIPVRSAMDGVVVVSAPNGVFRGYGETIVIKSKLPGGQIVYTVYAHLASRTIFNEADRQIGCCSPDFRHGGSFKPVPVQAGQVIGIMGKSSGTADNPQKQFNHGNPHLHYEWLTRVNGLSFPAKNKTLLPDIPIEPGDPTTRPAIGTTVKGIAISDNPRVLDPVTMHASLFGGVASLPESNNVLDATDQLDAEVDINDEDDSINPAGAATTPIAPAQTQPTQHNLDTVDTRRQLLRWGLLQDHWYQHNIEYISGQIVMRGAPEIRAGYRLDISDKRMSFYVDGVSHTWAFPGSMKTTLTVSRGQSNNPHPMYVLPACGAFTPPDKREQRSVGSRLGEFLVSPDPPSVSAAVVYRDGRFVPGDERTSFKDLNKTGEPYNFTDHTGQDIGTSDGPGVLDPTYSEYMIYPITDTKAADTATLEALLDPSISVEDALSGVIGPTLDGSIKTP